MRDAYTSVDDFPVTKRCEKLRSQRANEFDKNFIYGGFREWEKGL